jgi:hypothetical protein
MKRSNIILQGVARQVLQKVGVQLWWVKIPESVPLPAVFVGLDVFHAPRKFDPTTKTKSARASCAAIVVQVVRDTEGDQEAGVYSETFEREPGMEYQLGECLRQTVSNAMKSLNVNPMSCIVWRDGIGEGAFATSAADEIKAIRDGLIDGDPASATAGTPTPLSYIVCQKRIDTKLICKTSDGTSHGAPSGTLVEGIQGMKNHTFYINGRAPPYSTPKPVRFITIETDEPLQKISMPELT